MPAKPYWWSRLDEIISELQKLPTPVVDRAVIEQVFGVRRRRAIDLLHYFSGFQAGKTFLVERSSLLRQLRRLQTRSDFSAEQSRKRRLTEKLEKIRRYNSAAKVIIPAPAGVQERRFEELPSGIHLNGNELKVTFDSAEDLLRKLFEFSQAVANDFERFRILIETHTVKGTHPQ